MSPRTEEQYKQIREEKKALIITTALELFATEGYHHTSISMIASKANISKGLSYNYFNSKEDLLEEVLKQGFKKMAEMMVPEDGVLDTKEEFAEMIDKAFNSIQAEPKFWKLYYSLLFQQGFEDLYQRVFAVFIESYEKILCNYFKIMKVKDPKTMAYTFGAVLDGISLGYLMAPDYFPIEKIKKIIVEKFG
jgi:AcrR family transcriptional regulator